MRTLSLLLLAGIAIAAAKSSSKIIDASSVVHVQDRPGFWEERAMFEKFLKSNKKERKIVDGQEVEPNSIPWQVALITVYYDGNTLCSGSVISSRAVLTAAHCIGGYFTVMIAGAHDYWADEETQQWQNVYPYNYRAHEDYNPETLENDIGVIRLGIPLELNEYIQPARLPFGLEETCFVNQTATVSGWGLSVRYGDYSPYLSYGTVKVIKNSICKEIFGSNVNPNTICAHGQNPCLGDSGGSLTVQLDEDQPIQIGIVTFFDTKCSPENPVVYLRVAKYLKWLECHV